MKLYTISNTFSKILEIHMLDECGEHEFPDLQFGFINTRGTSMAAVVTYDLINPETLQSRDHESSH